MGVILFFVIFIILLMLIVLASRRRIKHIFRKYLLVKNTADIDGKTLASYLKIQLGLDDLSLARTDIPLGDAYYPKQKTLVMCNEVADSNSLASVTIVAHELGHAMQHKTNYFTFNLTFILGKITRFTNRFILPLLFIGLITTLIPWTKSYGIAISLTSIILFGFHLMLKLISIPLEYNASKRGLKMLQEYKIISNHELKGANKLLAVAAQTYIASLFDGIIISGKKLFAIFNKRRK